MNSNKLCYNKTSLSNRQAKISYLEYYAHHIALHFQMSASQKNKQNPEVLACCTCSANTRTVNAGYIDDTRVFIRSCLLHARFENNFCDLVGKDSMSTLYRP